MSGNIEATIALDTLSTLQSLYGLGAVEGLKGEIQIWDGNPLISYVDADTIGIDQDFSKKASLLVYSEVPKWNRLVLPEGIKTEVDLEAFLFSTAEKTQLDLSKPLIFRLEGSIVQLAWHFINWPERDKEHTHLKHKNAGHKGTINNEVVKIIGFYSKGHMGIFTHHSTNFHMHFKTIDSDLAGHIDNIQLGSEMILNIPAQ